MKLFNRLSKVALVALLMHLNVSLAIIGETPVFDPSKLDQRFIVEIPVTEQAKIDLRRELLRYCTEDAPAHARLTFIDSVSMTTKVEFSIPELRYDSASGRKNKLRQELGQLFLWLKNESGSNQSSGGNITARIPEVLDRIAPTTNHTRIIYICNPWM